jgi:signal transduction histidine kinase
MPLIDFIRANEREIIEQFEAFARTLVPASASMTPRELRDHAHDILSAVVADLSAPQTADEQSRKSMGWGTKHAMAASGELHADHRIAHRFALDQVVAEFRALRASVLRLYADEDGDTDRRGVQRFNEAMDEALGASIRRFADQMDLYKNQFVGVLSHDLRAPLSAITAGAALLTRTGELEAQRVRVASRILSSAQRMTRMIADLLDLTRMRLGSGIPIARSPMDLQALCDDVILELTTFHPDAEFECSTDGDLRGEWDADRLTQVVSNLVGNALQHGDGTRVQIGTRDAGDEVLLRVHNTGRAIPEAVHASIFEPLARHAPTEGSTTSIGLGLFIARAIVVAHGGTITVSSTEPLGTTFEVRLPRRDPSAGPQPS